MAVSASCSRGLGVLESPDPMGRKVRRQMIATLAVWRARAVARLFQEDGQALVEYALLLSLIALVAFGAVNEFGLGVSKLFSKVVAHYP